MTVHYTTDPNEEASWREPYCGVDGDEATHDPDEVECWECLAILGVSDLEIVERAGPSDFGGDGPVLRALGVID